MKDGLNNVRRRRSTNLFKGTPHVGWRGILIEFLLVAAFRINDCILKSPFACVESTAVFGGQNAFPAVLGMKMGLLELGDVG